MERSFEIQLAEMYYGVPILDVRCAKPTLLCPETEVELARAILALPYPQVAVVIDFRNLTHASGYGPEEEAALLQREPFPELQERVIAVVRYQAASMTSLIHSMRVNMMIRHSVSSSFAPDLDSAVRATRRAIDRSRVPTA